MHQIFIFLPIFMAMLIGIKSQAEQSLIHRPDVENFINFMVKKHGFDHRQLLETMAQATIQPAIINSINKPLEQKDWDTYKQLFLTQENIKAGIEFWQNNQTLLNKAEKIYQVPAAIIVAILGVESAYGKKQGDYRVLDALTTLAFNYPKRSQFFTKELMQFLLLCREYGIVATKYTGSYAGAIGKPQFMPSSYRYYATNFSGTIYKDLINDNDAVIASIANYLHKNGWQMQQEIAQPVITNGDGYKNILIQQNKALFNIQHLLAAGILPLSKLNTISNKVGLIELITRTGTEYWMTHPNFYVITRYNTSPQYAMVVYLLAQQLSINKKYNIKYTHWN